MIQVDPRSPQLMDSDNRVLCAVSNVVPGLTALVANPVEIPRECLPFQVGPGVVLDCATEEEIGRIGVMLDKVTNGFSRENPRRFYEAELKVEEADGSQRSSWHPLPRERWRYYVMRTDDNGRKNIDVGLVTIISHLHLDVASLAYGTVISASWNPHMLFNRFQWQMESSTTEHGSRDDLQEIAELYEQKLKVVGTTGTQGTFPELQRGLEMLMNLKTLSSNSAFHVLGLFAIIEMLITHNPKLEDRGDSITHQMKSKIPLLARRFDRPLPYDSHFGEFTSDKIWGALYAYRSNVAHGGELSFKNMPLKLLQNGRQADAFLLIVVKALLRHALREPYLYRDIREC